MGEDGHFASLFPNMIGEHNAFNLASKPKTHRENQTFGPKAKKTSRKPKIQTQNQKQLEKTKKLNYMTIHYFHFFFIRSIYLEDALTINRKLQIFIGDTK